MFAVSLMHRASSSIGYFSYQEVFQSMPDYAVAKRNIDDLSVKYDAGDQAHGR